MLIYFDGAEIKDTTTTTTIFEKYRETTLLWISGRQPRGCGPLPARAKFVTGPNAFSEKNALNSKHNVRHNFRTFLK